MKKKRLRIAIYNDPDGEKPTLCCYRTVVAEIVGPLAVHRGLAGCRHHPYGAPRLRSWTVTHVATTLAACLRLPSRTSALALARELRPLPWGDIAVRDDSKRWRGRRAARAAVRRALKAAAA